MDRKHLQTDLGKHRVSDTCRKINVYISWSWIRCGRFGVSRACFGIKDFVLRVRVRASKSEARVLGHKDSEWNWLRSPSSAGSETKARSVTGALLTRV